MKKNTKILIFSAIGIALLAAIVVILVLTTPKNSDENAEITTTTDERLSLSVRDAADIETIEIKNEYDSYTIAKTDVDGTAQWTLLGENITQSLYDQSAFTSIVGYAASLEALSVVKENADDLSQFGLDKDTTVFTVKYNDNTSKSIVIGNLSPSENAFYVCEKGKDTVYTYPVYKFNSFKINVREDYVTTSIMPKYDAVEAATIDKITINRKDLELPIIIEALPERSEGNIYTHAFTSPRSCNLDTNDGYDFLYAMYNLIASEAAYLEATDETKAKTGLDDPLCTVDMLVGSDVYRLAFGNPVYTTKTDDDTGKETTELTGYYVTSNQAAGIIYILSAESSVWVKMNPEDYMSKYACNPYLYDLERVEYKDSESSVSIKIEGNASENHFYDNSDGKEVSAESFKPLYQYFVTAKLDDPYNSEEAGELIATITYHYNDKSKTPNKIEFFSGVSDRQVVIAIDGVNSGKTRPMYTVRLKENVKAFLSGGEIVLTY